MLYSSLIEGNMDIAPNIKHFNIISGNAKFSEIVAET